MTQERITADTGERPQGHSRGRTRSSTGEFVTPRGALTGPLRVLSILLVSMYLSLVAVWLIATGRVNGLLLGQPS